MSTDAQTRRETLAAALQRVPTSMLVAELERREEVPKFQPPSPLESKSVFVMAGSHAPIIIAAARAWGIPPIDLFSRSRHPKLVGARQTAMGLLREAGLSLHQIAAVIRMHHTSAINAAHTIARWKRHRCPQLKKYLAAKNHLTSAIASPPYVGAPTARERHSATP